jgi:hypothetical protein
LGRLTDESESGSSDGWRTPTAAESHNQDYSAQVYLQNQVQENWPTARASAAHGPSQAEIEAGDPRHRLETAVMCQWPTPKARDWKGESQRGTDAPGDALMNMVNWATPASADCIGATGGGQGRSLRTDTAQSPGQLHPDWVETLQGYPVGWTDVGPPDRAKRSTRGSRRAQGTASPTEPPA